MPIQRVRCFVAIDISPECRARAEEAINEMGASGADVKWVEPHNLHLTLCFLGEVEVLETPEICAAVARGAQQHRSFPFELHGVGAFPTPDRPRTLWLGVREGGEPLCQLQESIANELQEIGFPKEKRKYTPHLTIGRVKRADNDRLAPLVELMADFDVGVTIASSAVVYSSRLSRHGPQYETLGRGKLRNR